MYMYLVLRLSPVAKPGDEPRNKASNNYVYIQYSWCSHVHVRLPGSGVHIPLDAQVAVILVGGTNIGLHQKNIMAPSVVFWYASIEPSVGGVGSLQFTKWSEKE